MPSRNVVKVYTVDSYYHVYNRGVAKQPIFLNNDDKDHFISIIARHFDPSNAATKSDGTTYTKFNSDLELLCYCLMGNHFHLLFYITGDPDALHRFMQSACTAYTMYFNKKYGRVGTLFQGVFKASRITSDSYLLHISRYIHLNPTHYSKYAYSSYLQYINPSMATSWLTPDRIINMFEGINYADFTADYDDYKASLEDINYDLAI